jgi:hypothetical protein
VSGQARVGDVPRLARVSQVCEVPAALDALGVRRGRPVVVLVGGAGGMDERDQQDVVLVLRDAVVPALERHGATVVDGGTDAGVMRLIGRARTNGAVGFPLVGVAAEGTVRVPGGGPVADDAAALEPHHTHVVLVPGSDWGDESPWLADVADAIAAGRPSLTVVVNGGEITYGDVGDSIARGRPVVVLAGTGRTADAIAAARAGRDTDPRAAAVAESALTRVVPVHDRAGVEATVDALLT